MAMVITDGAKLNAGMTATADEIRRKTGGSAPIAWDYTNDTGFAAAVEAIQTGGGAVLVELIATESRLYLPPEGTDGFSRVVVDVGQRSPRCDQIVAFDWGNAQNNEISWSNTADQA